jgi:hypothetical protein
LTPSSEQFDSLEHLLNVNALDRVLALDCSLEAQSRVHQISESSRVRFVLLSERVDDFAGHG